MSRFFLVEDHPQMRESMKAFLGFQPDLDLVGMAGSGEEALEQLERLVGAEVDVVLVDYSLPAMNGIELVRRIKQRWPDLRAILVSGHDEHVYGSRAREAQADGYVMKGDAQAIVDAARHVCKGGRYFNGKPEPGEEA